VEVSKDSLTLKANPDLALNAVVLEFGKFMKYIVCFSDVRIDTGQCFNAFEILKQSQLQLSRKRVPSCIEERNKKDKLYNRIIQYLEKEGLYWKTDEVISSGTNFVKSLFEMLWYIDGHHSTISSYGYQIPACFEEF